MIIQEPRKENDVTHVLAFVVYFKLKRVTIFQLNLLACVHFDVHGLVSSYFYNTLVCM